MNVFSNTSKSTAKKKNEPEIDPESDDEYEPPRKAKKKTYGPMDYYKSKFMAIPKNSPKHNGITNAIVRYIVEAMVPLHTVELESFKGLINLLEPG